MIRLVDTLQSHRTYWLSCRQARKISPTVVAFCVWRTVQYPAVSQSYLRTAIYVSANQGFNVDIVWQCATQDAYLGGKLRQGSWKSMKTLLYGWSATTEVTEFEAFEEVNVLTKSVTHWLEFDFSSTTTIWTKLRTIENISLSAPSRKIYGRQIILMISYPVFKLQCSWSKRQVPIVFF